MGTSIAFASAFFHWEKLNILLILLALDSGEVAEEGCRESGSAASASLSRRFSPPSSGVELTGRLSLFAMVFSSSASVVLSEN